MTENKKYAAYDSAADGYPYTRRYLVTWTHNLGGSNTELVMAANVKEAIQKIKTRQGESNLCRVTATDA